MLLYLGLLQHALLAKCSFGCVIQYFVINYQLHKSKCISLRHSIKCWLVTAYNIRGITLT